MLFFSFIAICNHMRAVEYFSESIIVNTALMLPKLFPENSELKIDLPKFKAVRCTRFAEFNFFIDKVKIGKLQCVNDSLVEAIMGYEANPAIPPGNYYLITNSEIFYAISDYGITPYLTDNALEETYSFQ